MIGKTISHLTSMVGAVAMVALVFLSACGKQPVIKPSVLLPLECEVLPGPEKHADTIAVVLLDAARAGQPAWAQDAGDRLLFHQLYETLINVDCSGEVQPGLAQLWRRGDDGRRWTFTLYEGARFWDGAPVTARDIAGSWRRLADGQVLRSSGIDSVSVAGVRTLEVYFAQPQRHVPRALSAPAFAVTKPPEGLSGWPVGSGPYQLVSSETGFAGISRRTITARPAFDARGAVIRFVETSKYDSRDMLESGIDVMVTADRAVIDYAAGRPRLATIALPWDRTYVLLSTSRVKELRWGGELPAVSPDLAERLAQDAVRGDARGHQSPSWWDDLYRCGNLSADVSWFPPVPRGADAPSGSRRILYDRNDGVARDLAERIVALAGTDTSVSAGAAEIFAAVPGLGGGASGIVAEGISKSELNRSLRDGDDFAYIVSIPRRPFDPCREARTLINRARWLSTFEVDLSKALIPLVETRLHVIVDSGAAGLMIDWYGNILILDEKLPGK